MVHLIKKMKKCRSFDDSGYSLAELMVAMVTFGLLMAISSSIIYFFLQDFNASQASINAQNNAQIIADTLGSIISDASPCPISSPPPSVVIAAPSSLSGSNALVFSAIIPGVSTTNGTTTTNIEVVTVKSVNGVISASSVPCNGFTGPSRLLVSAKDFIGVELNYSVLPSPLKWPYIVTSTPSSGQLGSIVAISPLYTFWEKSGNKVQINVTDYFLNSTCNQTGSGLSNTQQCL